MSRSSRLLSLMEAIGADIKALNSGLNVVSMFASPGVGGYVSGNQYDNAFKAGASGTLAGVADRIDLAPFFVPLNFTVDRIGVAVSTLVASAQGKCVVYSSNSSGLPTNLIKETAALDFGTTGYRYENWTYTFQKNICYWVGVRHSSTATLRTIALTSAMSLGLPSATGTNYNSLLRRTLAFANAAPNPWNFTATDLVAGVTPPSIRFRAL